MSKITLQVADTVEARILLRTLADHYINDKIPFIKIQHSLGRLSEDDMNKDINANLSLGNAINKALDKG